MSDHELRYSRTPGPIARLLGALGTSSLLQSLGDQELDEPHPQVVWHTARSSELRRVAFDLVDAGRDDIEATVVLARAAGRHAKELRRAAATIRSDRWIDEDLASYRAERLLVAAATGRPVDPLTDEQRAWFDRLRRLVELPPEEGFAELAAEEPELAGLEGAVCRLAAGPEPDGPVGERRDEMVREAISDLVQKVSVRSSSPLVRTHAARTVARDHLVVRAGLQPPDDPPRAEDQQA
ncbi:MAG TPA: hypothetical protein VND44_12190 [Acidimicrobiales bacterium]|nr:hypothetical protein [Acidimicrobiales bacterium]